MHTYKCTRHTARRSWPKALHYLPLVTIRFVLVCACAPCGMRAPRAMREQGTCRKLRRLCKRCSSSRPASFSSTRSVLAGCTLWEGSDVATGLWAQTGVASWAWATAVWHSAVCTGGRPCRGTALWVLQCSPPLFAPAHPVHAAPRCLH